MMRARVRRVTRGQKPRALLSGAIVSAVGYLTLAILAAQQQFAAIDNGTRTWVELIKQQAPNLPFALIAHLGDYWGLLSLLAVGMLFLFWRNQRRWALSLPVLMAGAGALQWLAKRASQRPRPDLEPWGFPSGHVLSLVVFFGLMIYLIATASRRRRRWRVLACLVCTAAVVLVAFSRLYLDRHWLSDVIGGFSVGVAYLLVAIWIVEVVWTRPVVASRVSDASTDAG
jgi:membrane-associated phospholipid phosphatase